MSIQERGPTRFQTPGEVKRYFSGAKIACLICGMRFSRLGRHLEAIHDVTPDEYRVMYGLPWARGLTSAVSRANSGWDDARRAKARIRAKKRRIFRLARSPQRELAPFAKVQCLQNVGIDPRKFGEKFERRLRALYDKGLSDEAIAHRLDVQARTVNRRTERWRKRRGRSSR